MSEIKTGNPDRFYDAIIIGGGPAGLTGAIYLARACYRVLVLEKEGFGGQITITSEVVNYPGVEKTNGRELTETMRRQAQYFGAEFMLADATSLDLDGDIKTVETSRGKFQCYGLMIATGAHPRMVGFKGETEWRGHGVAYCATCDGEFFTGKQVFVIGGGFAAAEESVFLTKYASHVTILIRGDDFTCAKSVADEVRKHSDITVLTNTTVNYVDGDDDLKVIEYVNSKTGEVTKYEAEEGDTFGVFVFAGYTPATELIKGKAELDPAGYVITDRNQKTSIDGVYAAGDVCVKNLRQVVTAVGDGATAATELEKYAAKLAEKTGFKPVQPQAAAKANAGDKGVAAGEKAGAAAGGKTGEKAGGTTAAGDGGQTPSSKTAANSARVQDYFSADINAQLDTVFARMSGSLILKVFVDESAVSAELKSYMEAIAARTEKISAEIIRDDSQAPCVKICRADGTWAGMTFHGVPGGHEFTSFVLALYNAAGPGQSLDEETEQRIRAIDGEKHMTILVSLSCTMCPELVTAAQRIAAGNPLVTTDVYDINHFPKLKEKYNVMSVPCYVINDGKPGFGKKNVAQLLDIL